LAAGGVTMRCRHPASGHRMDDTENVESYTTRPLLIKRASI